MRTRFTQRAVASSAFALDALNLSLSDMRDGVGPFLAIYLANQRDWTPSKVGMALAAASFSTLAFTAPAGFVLDRTKGKRAYLIGAAIAIGVCAGLLTISRGFWSVIALQVGSGAASALIGPGIAALTLGLVGRRALPNRIGRNETINHAGNLLTAAGAGALASAFSIEWVFYLVVAASAVSVFSILLIPKSAVDDQLASGLDRNLRRVDWQALLRNRELMGFVITVAAFQFANAALLPVAAQAVARTFPDISVGFLSRGIIVAQLTAAPVAWIAGRLSQTRSPYLVLLAGIAAAVSRAVIFALFTQPMILEVAQVLDGVSAGTMAVAPILAVAQMTKGTGRFGFATGILACSIGLGASASNLAAGFLTEYFGREACFLTMASVAALAFVALAIRAKQQL